MNRFDRSMLRKADDRERILTLLEAGLRAVDPDRVTAEAVEAGRDDECFRRRVHLVAIGKAATPMARGAVRALAHRLAGGIALTRYGHAGDAPEGIEVREAGHPIPDSAGVAASDEIRRLAERLGARDALLCLLSGGGSALLAAPQVGISLGDLACTTQMLLRSGAPIDDVNAVRRHLSRLHGGRLAALAQPACIRTFILSDVIGDRLEAIASGPTVPDPTTYADARRVLHEREIWECVPGTVRALIEEGIAGRLPETGKPGDPAFADARTRVIASNRHCLEAIHEWALGESIRVVLEAEPIVGEARGAGHAFAERAIDISRTTRVPTLLLSGGETTVTVRGTGKGGRNQEFALAAADALSGHRGIQVAAHATDGTDGTTSTAGALVDANTARLGRAAGFDIGRTLAENDAHAFLAATYDLLSTGATGTNVADVYLALIEPA